MQIDTNDIEVFKTVTDESGNECQVFFKEFKKKYEGFMIFPDGETSTHICILFGQKYSNLSEAENSMMSPPSKSHMVVTGSDEEPTEMTRRFQSQYSHI